MHSRLLAVLLIAALSGLSQTARADSRTDARRYFTRGMAAIRAGNPGRGARLLLRAYELRPHPNVLYNVANAYRALGDVNQAIAYYERYLASDPKDGDRINAVLVELRTRKRLRTLVDDGMAAVADKRYAEGVQLLQRAYSERPHANLLFNIARAQEESGDLEAALSNFQAYLTSKPRDASAVRNRLNKLREKIKSQGPRKPGRGRDRFGASADPKAIAEIVVSMLRESGVVGAQQPRPTDAAPPVLTATIAASDIQLEAKEGAGYEEVVVTASRREQSSLDAPNAVTIITADDIRLSGARSIPELLRRVPGMDVMQMSNADWNVALRGFNRRIANKLLVLVDGRTAYEDFLGGVLWSGQTYDLMDIARIEVVRGPGSAIYGANAYSGIVNIITKRPGELEGSTAFAATGSGNSRRAVYRFGHTDGPLGVRASVGIDEGDKFDFELDPDRVDFTAARPRTANLEQSLSVVRADAHVEYNLDRDAARLFVGAGLWTGFTEFYGVSALRNQNNEGTGSNVRVGYDSELFSVLAFWNALRTDTTPQFFPTGTPDLGSNVKADLIVVEPVFRPSFEFAGTHALVIGAEYRHKLIEWNYLDDDHTDLFFAVYAQDQWKISDELTVLASYRLDHHPLLGIIEQPDISFPGSPRVAAIYRLAENQVLRASFGTAFRVPNQAETYLALAAASPTTGVAVRLVGGQDKLLPEDIVTIELGYLNQAELGEFEVVGYFNRVNNIIQRTALRRTDISTRFDPSVGAFVGLESLFANEDRVFVAVGSELSTRLYPIDGLDVGASYAFQYIVDSDGNRFTDAPLHKATLWGQYRSDLGIDAGMSIHFVSSQDWIEQEFDPDDPSGFTTDPLPIDSSVVLIARVGYRLFDDQLELALSGTNLLDTGNNRHIEHPFGNRLQARVLGSATARF